MRSLHELQQRFVADLLTEDGATLLPWISEQGAPAANRLNVYRGNGREAFLAALAAGYPVLRRLTGEDYFRGLAREYQLAFPSPAGDLFHAGARLPQFLRSRFAETPYEYFSDVARLERACQEVLGAADHAALDTGRLAGVAPADYPRLRFELDPAVRLVRSVYPIVRIWEAHQAGGDPEPIDIGAGGEQALVQRAWEGLKPRFPEAAEAVPTNSVSVYRLPPAEYACLAALGGGRPLGAALEEASVLEPGFDLRPALSRWAELGFIVDFSILGASADA